MFLLYLLVNTITNRYYIGTTKDLTRRLIEHNKLGNKGFTGKGIGKWKLVGYKRFESAKEALSEEKRLKKAKNRKYTLWYFTN